MAFLGDLKNSTVVKLTPAGQIASIDCQPAQMPHSGPILSERAPCIQTYVMRDGLGRISASGAVFRAPDGAKKAAQICLTVWDDGEDLKCENLHRLQCRCNFVPYI